MRKILFSLLFSCIATIAFSQSWNWVNSTTSKSFARFDAIATDANGFSYVCGVFNDSTWFGSFVLVTPAPWISYAFVAKYSPSGTCIWAKCDSLKEAECDIVLDSERNCYVVGSSMSQFVLTKWDSSGTKLWDSPLPANTYSLDVEIDTAGHCWLSVVVQLCAIWRRYFHQSLWFYCRVRSKRNRAPGFPSWLSREH